MTIVAYATASLYGGNMTERKGAATFQGNPLTLVGNELKVGDRIPDVELTDNNMKPVRLGSFKGNLCIISSVPSLDTSVCDLETRRFNKEALELGGNVKILTISMDLPFAQKRWCGQAGVGNVITLSDYKNRQFGELTGTFIKELGLLSRSVFIVDRGGIVRYIQHVKEITTEPNYAEIIGFVRDLKGRQL